jgi:putative ABC transport system ATP-binding protein
MVALDGIALNGFSEDAVAGLRLDKVGIVFQAFHLVPTLTALENVAVPLELAGESDPLGRALARLDEVGLRDRAHHYPVQLSGGEQQRVALARACARRPPILLADEPTGNLDTATGAQVIALLRRLHQESGNTLVLVTHDASLTASADRVITLRDGRVVDDTGHGARR